MILLAVGLANHWVCAPVLSQRRLLRGCRELFPHQFLVLQELRPPHRDWEDVELMRTVVAVVRLYLFPRV